MFVVNPDPYSLPTYRIGPFKTDDVARNAKWPADDFMTDYFDRRFGKSNWQLTFNGREAIRLALESYQLQSTDLVTVLTTSQNFYISSCVTREIESLCRWNRELLPETKLIFVNHEFGFPYPEMQKLISTGLPIIEDCCTTFFSQDEEGKLGHYGDYSVFSFPKFFPLQIGGLLVKNSSITFGKASRLTNEESVHISYALSHYLRQEHELLATRRNLYDYAVRAFLALGFSVRFAQDPRYVPSALLLKNNGIVKDLPQLKNYLNEHGIQNSVFYGEDTFFLPVHQNLSEADFDYFVEVIRFYIQNQK